MIQSEYYFPLCISIHYKQQHSLSKVRFNVSSLRHYFNKGMRTSKVLQAESPCLC